MKITLKDGSSKEYAQSMSVIDIAKDISEGLARVATAGEVDGEVVDLRTVIDKDCELNILTFNDEKGKGAFRHTTSHIMAQAIKRLYPDTKLAIGPSIEDGFYYDIDRETPLVAEDLEKIEADYGIFRKVFDQFHFIWFIFFFKICDCFREFMVLPIRRKQSLKNICI